MNTGRYLPPQVVTNFDLMKVMETSDEFIVQRTGVRRRRYAPPEMAASDMAVAACRDAVADAGLGMDQIDMLVMNTITPDHADPGCACFLQAKLGLCGTPVLDIKQQCAGLIYGLSLADHYLRAGTCRHVLIACSEKLSTRIDGSYEGRNIAVLLGDGAGAAVVGPSPDGRRGILSTILHADGRYAKALYTAAPGSALGRREHLTHEDLDACRVHFRMDGKAVFQNGVEKMSDAVLECLRASGLTLDDIQLLVPHQANLRMLEAIEQRLGIARRKVYVNVEDYGNIASASLPIALDESRRAALIQPGNLVLLVAFGSGFVWGSALLRA
jgi:3-oxoacyl-[acyl-carrier-protein] synthase-3